MDFDFSDDRQQLRDAVRKWVDKGYSFERRRAIVAAGGFDRAAYGELAELGLTALTVPEQHDGMGQGAVDAMVVMEELGRGMVLEPLAHAFITSSVLSSYAPAAVQSAWLPRIASGEALVVLAHQERKARYRLDVCEAKATAAPAGYALTATKSIVPAGDQADAFLVPAQLDGKLALFLVERAASGVTTRGYVTQDGSRAAEVWAKTGGTDCSNVIVGIIDEGYMYNHTDLAANAFKNPGETAGNGVDDDGNGYIDDVYGYDFGASSANVRDTSGPRQHGTMTSGIVAGDGSGGIVTVKRVLESPHDDFTTMARSFATRARFTPPKKDGRSVNALFRWPLILRS